MSHADAVVVPSALFDVGPVVGILGLCIGVTMVFRRAGHRTFAALAWRGLVSIVAIILIAVAGIRLTQHSDMSLDLSDFTPQRCRNPSWNAATAASMSVFQLDCST
jgi:hypothetical protein